MKTRLLLLACASLLLLPSVSAADPLDKVNDSVSALDFALKRLEGVIASAKKVQLGKQHDDMQRFLNGIYLLKNNRPQDAAALFLSLISHPTLGKEATFYLSEAMFTSANYLVAADYYWMVVEQRWDPAFRSKAIKRLLEISIKTQNYRGIEKLVELVEQMPELKDSPEVNYARGKFAYYQAYEEFQKPAGERREAWANDKFLEALRFFDKIGPTLDKDSKKVFPLLYPQAVYFSGAALVRMGQVGATSFVRGGKTVNLTKYTTSLGEMREMLMFEAVRRFSVLASDTVIQKWIQKVPAQAGEEEIKYFEPRNDEEKEVQALSRMALGRIFYELGETGEAVRWYKLISDKSPHYEDALYEMAWVYVREEEVMKAAETLAIMEVRNRNSVFLPRARLLLGYLNVRGERWAEANKAFSDTATRYKAVHLQIKELMEKQLDLKAFFDQITRKKEDVAGSGKDADKKTVFRLQYAIPPEAIPLFQEDQTLMKAILVTEDITGIGDNLEHARDSLLMIKRRLQSASKIGLFPLLADTRTKTYEMEIKNVEARAELLKVARAQFARHVTGNTASQLKKAEEDRQKLEKDVKTMPRSTDSLANRLASRRKVFDEKILAVDNLIKDLQGYQQLVGGMYEYYKKQKPERQKQLAPMLVQLQEESSEIESGLEMARSIRAKIMDASLTVGVDDADMEAERRVRTQYRSAIAAEFAVWSSIRGKLSSAEMVLFDKMVTLMQNADAMDRRIDDLNGKLQALADERLAKIKEEITVEEANLKAYEVQYLQYKQQSGQINELITAESIRLIARHFHDVVVESDLGIVDVNWSLRSKTRLEWIRLNDRNKQITNEMKNRYREVEANLIEFDEERYADPFVTKAEPKEGEKPKPGTSDPGKPGAGGQP
ncbi:hypothetical protein KJ975_11230 [Myxococcota bacterium]|nr:hypothetical protein [Myxococcota bacterium]